MSERENLDVVLQYHSRTKHHLHRFAPSLGYLDWATQPDPFRTFEGAGKIELPLSAGRMASACYDDLYTQGAVPGLPLDRDSVAAFFELALGLSAWKQYQRTRWALRCNPSSGNLHPTEGYAVLPKITGLESGVYHYLPHDHCLERRCIFESEIASRLTDLLPAASFLVGLSSIHWREAWKYGERAFRYCQHDMGHAIGTVRYAAATLGWPVKLLDVSDSALADVLGLNHSESFSSVAEEDKEYPGALLLVGPGEFSGMARLQNAVGRAAWLGRANVLSPEHVPWPAIDAVAEATWLDGASADNPAARTWELDVPATELPAPRRLGAAELIQQRRSAVALDDVTSIPSPIFYGMLDRLMPRPGAAPWDVLPWPPHLHCGIFVHRVEGLPPGLYLLERNSTVHAKLRSALSSNFMFDRPDGCPEHLPFFKLIDGDFRQQAQVVSCHQRIAGAGAFSLGMIAEFADSLRRRGPSWYRRLFWESGLLGQVLYLEAEAAGLRGTGIGCYFDDVFHDLLGIKDSQFQSLYHFTVGGPVDDNRLTTLPAYAHLQRHKTGSAVQS
jgi:SagB-type dehydrogenase family enzyme